MKKVLIAVDYNPSSQEVAEKGYELSKLMRAEVSLIHVMSDVASYDMRYPTFMGYTGYEIGAVDISMMEEMQKVTEEYLSSVAGHLNDPNIKTHLAEGEAGRAILEYAEEWNADVIVMGTHSHSALEKLLMGTVASRVIEKTKIPVYLIPVKVED